MRRRALLTLGIAAAAVLAVGGAGLALLQPGWRDGRLSGRAREVFAAVARAVLDGSLPADQRAAARELDALLGRLDATIAGLPPHAQDELSQLLALLGTAPGRLALAGLREDWPGASVASVQAALQAMRRSRAAPRQQAYQALHDLVCSSYFSSPATWDAIGYPGPPAI